MTGSIQVQMLGDFTLQEMDSSDIIQADLSGRSRRLWILIAYLVVNRDRGVPPEELFDVLWPQGAGDNPMATLQNNVSRARSTLQKEGFKDARNLFKFENGLYWWAPSYTTIVDIDIFEQNAKELEENVDEDNLEEAYATCQMYKGYFLEQATGETWCLNLRNFFQSLFMRLCSSTVQALLNAERLQEARELCLRAIEIDPTAEIFSVFLMRSFVLEGQPKQALDHYDSIKRLFETEYNASVSSELEFERNAANQALYGDDTNEASIRAFLRESADARGAFQCSNSVFREIVQLQMRELQRNQGDTQLAIIGFDQTDMSLSQQTTNMKRLENALLYTLRSGDPFTRMNALQYLALLPSASRENGEVVVQRVVDRFRQDHPQLDIDFHTFLFDLAAFNDEDLGQ